MGKTITDEQFAARELVRDWAAGSGAMAAVRDIEQGEPKAWRPVFAGLAELGLFGVAVPEEHGGAGGSIDDLGAMVEEAAKALVPGPVATHRAGHAGGVGSDAARGARIRGAHRRAGTGRRRGVRRGDLAGVGHRAVGAGRPADGLLLVPAGDDSCC